MTRKDLIKLIEFLKREPNVYGRMIAKLEGLVG